MTKGRRYQAARTGVSSPQAPKILPLVLDFELNPRGRSSQCRSLARMWVTGIPSRDRGQSCVARSKKVSDSRSSTVIPSYKMNIPGNFAAPGGKALARELPLRLTQSFTSAWCEQVGRTSSNKKSNLGHPFLGLFERTKPRVWPEPIPSYPTS